MGTFFSPFQALRKGRESVGGFLLGPTPALPQGKGVGEDCFCLLFNVVFYNSYNLFDAVCYLLIGKPYYPVTHVGEPFGAQCVFSSLSWFRVVASVYFND